MAILDEPIRGMPFAKNYITGGWAFHPWASWPMSPELQKNRSQKMFSRIDQIKSLL